MKTLTKTLATVAGALMISTAGIAWAIGPGDGCPGDHWRRQGDVMFSEALNLSPEQKTQIQAIRSSYGFEGPTKGKRNAMKEQRFKEPGVMTLDPSAADYEAQVDALIERKTAHMEERMRNHAKMHAEIYAILTPEQQAKLVELKSTMKQRMQERMQDRVQDE